MNGKTVSWYRKTAKRIDDLNKEPQVSSQHQYSHCILSNT